MQCPACNGEKTQVNKDGLKVICPACGGFGEINQTVCNSDAQAVMQANGIVTGNLKETDGCFTGFVQMKGTQIYSPQQLMRMTRVFNKSIKNGKPMATEAEMRRVAQEA